MKDFFRFSICLYITLFCVYSESLEARSSDKEKPVIVFGDSYAYGYGGNLDIDEKGAFHYCLEAFFKKQVINMGRVGDTSTEVLGRLDKVLALSPSVVVLSVGGNDVLRNIFDGDFPEALTYNNINEIFKKLSESHIDVVHMGLEVIDQETGLPSLEAKRLPFIADVAKSYEKVIFVPRVMEGFWGDEEKLPDGLHPTDEGYKVICRRMINAIEPFYGSKKNLCK